VLLPQVFAKFEPTRSIPGNHFNKKDLIKSQPLAALLLRPEAFFAGIPMISTDGAPQ
jgi:hypothetical protein